MHDRFAARCKAAAAAAANLAYIIRYIHSLPLSIYTYIYTEWIEQWSSKRLTSLSSCLPPLSALSTQYSLHSLSGLSHPSPFYTVF